MLALSINKPKEFLISHPKYQLTFWQWIKFKYYLLKRKRGWPIAYLLEKKEFYSLEFYINESVLIPRPETELMVDEAIKTIKSDGGDILLADIGTGSGCIPISILKNTDLKEALAVDISSQTLEVARKNADRHQVELKLKQGNLLDPIKSDLKKYSRIIITANLPYLTQELFQSENTIQKEPRQALIADNDGLGYYEKLLQQISSLDIKDKNITLFFEINPQQKDNIQEMIKNYLPKTDIKIKKDLKKHDRLVKINS